MENNLKEEKLQILKMIEERKITPEEGINLLDALENVEETYVDNKQAKWLKIKVFDPDDNTKINVTIPIALIDVGMKMAGKFGPAFVPELKEADINENDLKELFEAIKNGAMGKLVDIESEDGEKVEIVVE
ncbi:hypothetical protein EDD65_10715 [Keratinibaculum paraultunense]|uniref:YvlB/LiaX N-terminal domain-containing protein n=1 Tax=Keratinibaculum paraultunense TaxID=1278232 RepID=A0A4R3KTV1_9FIRM|nr:MULTISPECIES: hypothetical protein [Bacillota]MBU5456136.1 hypothetical protein [Caproiciproducens sp. MSJ-32]QQY79785.1 hypothetical protein JL105_00140 [Keratinibaculum paraultunense]TCS88665.1 hypothetical protein EDD65_10715 [Keratinibaculum paraultunense]